MQKQEAIKYTNIIATVDAALNLQRHYKFYYDRYQCEQQKIIWDYD